MRNGIRPVIWLLGVSGSGKTTLGSLLRLYLEAHDCDVTFVDADRFGSESTAKGERLVDDLRDYVLEVHEQDRVCVVSAITPYASMRRLNREYIPLYKEVWLRCDSVTATLRDPRGCYRRSDFCEDFDEPEAVDLILDTDRYDLADCYVALRNFAREAVLEGERWSSYLSELSRPLFSESLSQSVYQSVY